MKRVPRAFGKLSETMKFAKRHVFDLSKLISTIRKVFLTPEIFENNLQSTSASTSMIGLFPYLFTKSPRKLCFLQFDAYIAALWPLSFRFVSSFLSSVLLVTNESFYTSKSASECPVVNFKHFLATAEKISTFCKIIKMLKHLHFRNVFYSR